MKRRASWLALAFVAAISLRAGAQASQPDSARIYSSDIAGLCAIDRAAGKDTAALIGRTSSGGAGEAVRGIP